MEFNILIPASFSFVEAILKLLLLKLHYRISLIVLNVLKSLKLEMNFQFRKKEKIWMNQEDMVIIESYALA